MCSWIQRLFPHASLVAQVVTLVLVCAWAGCSTGRSAAGTKDVTQLDFASRCALPEVVRCFGFDSQVETDPYVHPPWGEKIKLGFVVSDVKSSGTGSLRFEVPSNSGDDSSGSFKLNFSDDLSTQFGEGEEFFVQWRQRFSEEFLNTYYEEGLGWKQIIIGEGDRLGVFPPSCTQLEIVLANSNQIGFPQAYHSCGAKDGQFEQLGGGGSYVANEWMTFQIHVAIGTWYKSDGNYHRDSTVQLWVGREGRASNLVVNFTPDDAIVFGVRIPGTGNGYDIANDNPMAKYGKLHLTPYHTRKNPSQVHPTGFVWYDDLIISRKRIADPK